MAKLKLGAIADDKPVKLTVELPADVHRDSHQCWRDSWQPTEPLQRPAARVSRRKAGDSARSTI